MNKKGVLSSRNKQYWINKGYSEKKAIELARSRMPGTLEYFTIYKNISVDEASVLVKEFQNKRTITKENLIRKYGYDEGILRWKKYIEKQSYTNSWEYFKNKGYTQEQFLQLNKSKGLSGKKNPMFNTSYYEVWIKKYGKEEADRMNKAISIKKAVGGKKQKGIPKSEKTKKALSVAAKARVKRQGTITSYNQKSISIIEQYGKQNGYNFKHAENGGEFHVPNTNFMVDGYDTEKNVVIEYDEPRHFIKENLNREDILRQQIIMKELNCKFIRIKYNGEITIYEN